MIATNFVLVTNVVLITVTNYVVTTNMVLTTNAPEAVAKTKPAKVRKPPSPPDLSWTPPPDTFDWIQLKSGEWLKGRFQGMQKRELDFYSEEMDDQTFDWKDIRQMRSHRTVDALFDNDKAAFGPVFVTPSQVTILGEPPQSFARSHLQSLTPGGNQEWDYWSGKLTLGLALQTGNTKQVDYNAQAHLERRTPATRLSLDYIGNISSVNNVESANNHRVNSEFDLWLTRRLYLLVPFVEYYRDPFQNLDHRGTVGAGVGYSIIDRSRMQWDITSGPAYQKSWFTSTQPGEPSESATAALVFGTRFDWEITPRIEVIFEYRGQYTSRETGETTHHAVSTLSLDITKRFDFDVSLIWDRINNPKVGADGVQPVPDDFRLVVGVGLDF